MGKGLTLKIIAIIIISTVGIMFGGYVEQMKVNTTGIYSSVEKTKTAKETVEDTKGFKEVEEFKDYDKKDTSGMQKIDMSKYFVYIPENAELKNLPDKNKIYYNKSIKFTCSLNESKKSENLFSDLPDSMKTTLKKTYGKDPNSYYDSLYLFYTLQSENAMKKDDFAKLYGGTVSNISNYQRVWSYDNGKIKAIIAKDKPTQIYTLEIFSKDEIDNVRILIKADYDTMCKVVNLFEFK